MERSYDRVRELGQRKGDFWTRFDRLQKNLGASREAKEKGELSNAFVQTRISRMDETTRPPQKEDLVKLCEELNRLGASYIVIGGLAMYSLGLVRTTEGCQAENQRLADGR